MILAVLFAASVVGAYLSLNYLPFDSYRIAWERIQILYLVLYYLALTVPFFCAGLVTGLLLAAHPGHAARLYAANLLGLGPGRSAAGADPAPHGEGVVSGHRRPGLVAALVFQWPQPHPGGARTALPRTTLLLAACGLLLVLAWFLPAPFQLRLSPYKGLSQVLRFPDARSSGSDGMPSPGWTGSPVQPSAPRPG